jgi:acyl-CoA synthetase
MRLFPQDQVDEFLREGWWSGRTWLDHVAGHVRDKGDDVALVDAPNRESFTDGAPRRLTWSQADAEVQKIARSLYRAGVRQGDVVGVQLPNTVELALAYLAVVRLGAITSPFPVQYARHELTQMGTMAGLSTFLTTTRAGKSRLAEQALALVGHVPTLGAVLAYGDSVPAGAVALDEDLRDDAQDAEFSAYADSLELHPNDCVTLCWTSGTEGVPKGVPRAHGDWEAIAGATTAEPRLAPSDVLLNLFPMVNAGGMGGMFLPWILLGARLVQHHPFDLETFLQQIETERVTYTCAPPAVLDSLAANGDLMRTRDLSSLRAVGSGSAPLAGWMIEAWERGHGVEVLNLFGSNEGLCLFGCPDTVPDPADRGRLFPRPGDPSFAWRARIGRESQSRLVDVVTGEDIDEPSHPGELRVRSAALFAGYWGDVPAPFDEQGFFRTGDIFEFADEGAHTLVYVDRAKDLISRGGYKVSAAEVEALLSAHPEVSEVAVVGMPDDRLGERVCVFLVPRAGASAPTLDDLVQVLSDQGVARFKWPERLVLLEALPRNPIGKVLKRDLREQLRGEPAGVAVPTG